MGEADTEIERGLWINLKLTLFDVSKTINLTNEENADSTSVTLLAGRATPNDTKRVRTEPVREP